MLGAALWTVGLFLVAGIVVTQIMFRHPDAPRIFHDAFSHTHVLAAAALVCAIGGLLQVRRGLSPVNRLRARLSAVHDGRASRVEGRSPSEVQPLVDDLNDLLEQRERAIGRALAKAGDLAHGLKTPLALLAQDAERATAVAQHGLAASIDRQVERMRRQIEYHLAHARAAASGGVPGARCPVLESAEGLARTMRSLHAGRGIAIEADVPGAHAVRCQREDLDEMLGNLLDNACKWARSRVAIASSQGDGVIVITVDDDGPGLEPSRRSAVLRRGVRSDEAAAGSGLGLAIVNDLAELYGGSITLDASPLGGVRAALRLPVPGVRS
jgi:signal transduction histidine kinase